MGSDSSKKVPLNNDVDATKTKRISFTPSLDGQLPIIFIRNKIFLFLDNDLRDEYIDISEEGKKVFFYLRYTSLVYFRT